MAVVRRIAWSPVGGQENAAVFDRGLREIFDPALRSDIGRLIDDVRERGDAAVCEALSRFDGVEVGPEGLRVTDNELAAAQVSGEVDRAIDAAIANLRVFNEQQLERSGAWSHEVTINGKPKIPALAKD